MPGFPSAGPREPSGQSHRFGLPRCIDERQAPLLPFRLADMCTHRREPAGADGSGHLRVRIVVISPNPDTVFPVFGRHGNLCTQSVQQDMPIGADPGELFMAYSRTQKHLQNPGVADCLVARSFPGDTA